MQKLNAKDQEIALWRALERADLFYAETHLASEFTEVRWDGTLWLRQDALASLGPAADMQLQFSDWSSREVSPGIHLVGYELRYFRGLTRRTVLWDMRTAPATCLFHQATIVTGG